MRARLFASKGLQSRIHGREIRRSERIFGYFLGPCLAAVMYSAVSGTYLIQFYTDVLGLAGGLIAMMPLAAKLFSSLTELVFGRLIDRTRTMQGKARPWLLASGIVLPISGLLMYSVPQAGEKVQIAWVIVSYHLFSGVAFAVYSLSHSLMIPLSTRDTAQRDGLAMLTSTGVSIIPGMLTTVVMPILIQKIGVGTQAYAAWLKVMGGLSAIALPAVLLEYYFTLERVTMECGEEQAVEPKPSFAQQISACVQDRYWLLSMAFMGVYTLLSGLSGGSMIYYCNWVLGDSVADGATKQILVNVIGQAPLGIGVAALWPLVRRFGKRRVTIAGFAAAALGSAAVLIGSGNMTIVLSGLFIRSIGMLPSYVMAAHQADALDHVERVNGFRADGVSASAANVLQTALSGLSQTILLWGIHAYGYIPPESVDQVIVQPEATRAFLNGCFAGIPMIGLAVCAAIMVFFKEEMRPSQTRTTVDGAAAE